MKNQTKVNSFLLSFISCLLIPFLISAQPIDRSADTTIKHRSKNPDASRPALGIFAELNFISADISRSNTIPAEHLNNYFIYDPNAPKASIMTAMGGNFTIPASGFAASVTPLFNGGMQADNFLSNRWRMVIDVGYFSSKINTIFPVSVVPSGGGTTTVYPKDGKLVQQLNGFSGDAGFRYFLTNKKITPFVEMNIGFLASAAKVTEASIRNISFSFSEREANQYWRTRFGPGLKVPLGNKFSWNSLFQGAVLFGKNQTTSFSLLLHTSFVFIIGRSRPL